MAIMQVIPKNAKTIEDLAAIMDLMTIIMETGDPVCDEFMTKFPHLVVDVTEMHAAVNEVFNEENLSGLPVIPN